MITFINGPADGKTLMLRRVPFFLRVVFTSGTLDALDQVEDVPKPEESILVYLRQPDARPHQIHLQATKRAASGWFARGTYKLSPVQPKEDVWMRDALLWQTWCKNRTAAQWEPPLDPAWEAEGWLPMWSAEKTAANEVRVRNAKGETFEPAHFAQDLSGEEQPPFSGWFLPAGSGYAEVPGAVVAWQPLAPCDACAGSGDVPTVGKYGGTRVTCDKCGGSGKQDTATTAP